MTMPSGGTRNRRRCPDRHRGGYALVEMIVVISVNSALMAVAVGLIGALLRTEHLGQHHCERTSALVRLADQFREDLAEAREAAVVHREANKTALPDVDSQVKQLRLDGPDERMIEYGRDGERIRRIESQNQRVVRREAYHVLDLTDAGFEVSDDKLVSLHLTLGDEASGARDVWRIDARLAKNARFAREKKP
jgi:Tfp pilus assembly protein FimT